MIYAISDLHLPSSLNKNMDLFGWGNHVEKIKQNWCLNDEDYVIIPGDLSWALKESELIPDLEFLNSLKGKKVLLKGNHDMWWNSKNKVKKMLESYPTISILQYDSISINNISICGTRGWDIKAQSEDDLKKIEREAGRLKMSLDSAQNEEKIVFLHYPPVYKNYDFDLYLNILKQYNIKKVYYGHLHSYAIKDAIQGEYDGIFFKCIASDQINFKPIIVA